MQWCKTCIQNLRVPAIYPTDCHSLSVWDIWHKCLGLRRSVRPVTSDSLLSFLVISLDRCSSDSIWQLSTIMSYLVGQTNDHLSYYSGLVSIKLAAIAHLTSVCHIWCKCPGLCRSVRPVTSDSLLSFLVISLDCCPSDSIWQLSTIMSYLVGQTNDHLSYYSGLVSIRLAAVAHLTSVCHIRCKCPGLRRTIKPVASPVILSDLFKQYLSDGTC